MFFGWLTLATLSSLALVAGLSLSVRARYESRSEQAVAVAGLWHGIIVLPILALGWANRLTPWALGGSVLLLSLLAFALSLPRGGARAHIQNTTSALWGLIRLPFDAIRGARGSFVTIALVAAAGCLIWTGCLSYLAPSTAWDGIWYHELIIGYAIQNHGFAIVGVPAGLQHVNGFPRVCEALNVWFVIFTDRRLIELPNSVMGVPLTMAVYAIARRYADRNAAMGWACAILLMPGVVLQLASTYIDVHVAALFFGALVFCTRPQLRLRDAWIAALWMGLLAGSKGLALAWVPLLGFVGLTRAIAQNGMRRPWQAAGTIVGGVALVLLIAGPFYLRNWLVFHNPIWPVTMHSQRFHIDWPGAHDILEMNKPLKEMILTVLSVPVPGRDWPDTRVYGYGLGIPWLVLPIGMLALGLAVLKFAAYVVGLVPRDRRLENVLIVVAPMLLTIPTSPALWAARYNIHLPVAFMFLVAWLFGTRALLQEAFTSIVVATSLMMLWWAEPGWITHFPAALYLAHQSPRDRAAYHAAEYTMARDTALAREAELGPGDLTAWADTCIFPSLLWNEAFSNRIQYFPININSPDEFVDRVEQSGAKWLALASGSPEWLVVTARTAKWQQVGAASTTGPPSIAFRRKL
ncbi:MAG TPA: hypothetical protein VK550_11660 [Polyangiaceae bacterium]|nr:hypothetical protein [Polyangiaceae bacterium]